MAGTSWAATSSRAMPSATIGPTGAIGANAIANGDLCRKKTRRSRARIRKVQTPNERRASIVHSMDCRTAGCRRVLDRPLIASRIWQAAEDCTCQRHADLRSELPGEFGSKSDRAFLAARAWSRHRGHVGAELKDSLQRLISILRQSTRPLRGFPSDSDARAMRSIVCRARSRSSLVRPTAVLRFVGFGGHSRGRRLPTLSSPDIDRSRA